MYEFKNKIASGNIELQVTWRYVWFKLKEFTFGGGNIGNNWP
jgi:hypothetical protein